MTLLLTFVAVAVNVLNIIVVIRRDRGRQAAYRQLVVAAQHRCRSLEAMQRGDHAAAEMLLAAADEATDRAFHHLGVKQERQGVGS